MRLDTHGTLTYANAASAPLMEAWKATVGAPVDKNILVQLRWAAARGAPVNQFLGDRVFKVMANPVEGFDFMNVYATEETAMHKLKDLQEDMIRQERMSILGQLMAGIAHELNTPLGAISGSINNLLRTADRWFREDLPNLDKQDIPLIDRHARKADLQAGDHYNRQKALRNALRANHPQLAEDGEYASMLTDMGWHTPLNEEQEALLRHPRATDVLKTIHTIVSISSSASIIRFASERSGRIVKALRSYSHKDLGEFPVAFDIHRQITDLQQLFATGVRKGIKFAVHSDGPLVINGFEDQLSHVWTNLYNNAIQAMGNQGELVVRIGKSGDDAIVSFSNNGPMIPPNITERIFEPMFTTKARGEGTGMGLSIARSIVHEHGGVITCVSGPDETTFTVRLPMDHRRELPGRERGPAKVLN
jgi:signal transduction histidine kinase